MKLVATRAVALRPRVLAPSRHAAAPGARRTSGAGPRGRGACPPGLLHRETRAARRPGGRHVEAPLAYDTRQARGHVAGDPAAAPRHERLGPRPQAHAVGGAVAQTPGDRAPFPSPRLRSAQPARRRGEHGACRGDPWPTTGSRWKLEQIADPPSTTSSTASSSAPSSAAEVTPMCHEFFSRRSRLPDLGGHPPRGLRLEPAPGATLQGADPAPGRVRGGGVARGGRPPNPRHGQGVRPRCGRAQDVEHGAGHRRAHRLPALLPVTATSDDRGRTAVM